MYRPVNLLPQEILHEIQMEKEQIIKIRKQRDLIGLMQAEFAKKNQQISKLQQQLLKYKGYYDSFSKAKSTLSQKTAQLAQKEKENKLLLQQIKDVMKQYESIKKQLQISDKERHQLIRQRHKIQNCNREIQQTFIQYKSQCKQRQSRLLLQIDKLNRQNKDMFEKYNILEREITIFKTQQESMMLANKNSAKKDKRAYSPSNSMKDGKQTYMRNCQLIEQNKHLRNQLFQKDQQLSQCRLLNNELSIDYDKAVNSIRKSEEELNYYRRENHQLKKTLALFMQKQKYDIMYKKEAQRQDVSEQEEQEDQSQQRSISNNK